MDLKEKILYFVSFAISIFLGLFFPSSVDSEYNKNLVIINFGDSNSDTGGYVITRGMMGQLPKIHTFNHDLSGRMCDGRLIIDFLCKLIHYLRLYLIFILKVSICVEESHFRVKYILS